jgi:hypothetical protein
VERPARPSLVIVVCAEANRTGPDAVVLARSVRRFGGASADAPIVAVSPRGLPPGGPVADLLRGEGVEIVEPDLNPYDGPGAGFHNKVAAMAWAEREMGADRLVFMDSDSVVLGDLGPVARVGGPVMVTPAWARGVATRGRDDAAEGIWRSALDSDDLPPVSIRTRVTDEPVRPYFNSGLIAADRRAGLFTAWEAVAHRLRARPSFLRALAREAAPPSLYFEPATFLDQIALAGAVVGSAVEVEVLDWRHNSPLHYLARGEVPGAAGVDRWLDRVVHAQHQGYLGWVGMADRLRGAGADEVVAWIADQSALLPDPGLEWPPTFIRRFDAEMDAWRRDLRRDDGTGSTLSTSRDVS